MRPTRPRPGLRRRRAGGARGLRAPTGSGPPYVCAERNARAKLVCPPTVLNQLCSDEPVVSSTGRFVAFRSRATNLVLNDNGVRPDVFIRDRLAGTTELVSLSTDGQAGDGSSGEGVSESDTPGIAVSADGRLVAFVSDSTNFDPWTPTTGRTSPSATGNREAPSPTPPGHTWAGRRP